MKGAPSTAPDPVNILVGFGRVFSEVDACPKHAADVGMSLIEPFVDNRIDERTTVKEHPFVWTVSRIVLANLLLPVVVSLPQSSVPNLLHFDDVVPVEETARIVPVFPDGALHLILDHLKLPVHRVELDDHGAGGRLSRQPRGRRPEGARDGTGNSGCDTPTGEGTAQQFLHAFDELVSMS